MKPATREACVQAQAQTSVGLDDALKKFLAERAAGPTAPIYQMLMYFMGFLDEKFRDEKPGAGGKRFRPGLMLFIADAYGARDAAFDAALAVELFHNFTLVHDDVEDRDEERRNRPTVWKLWGVNHAINSGDALSLLASELCLQSGSEVGSMLLKAFGEVTEGQYLDFELADRPFGHALVSKETALFVNAKKTGALIRASCEAAGMATKQQAAEIETLRAYGEALGALFQLVDDYRSVWETQETTGKDTHSDIREHKRTLPFFLAHEELSGEARQKVEALYGLQRQLTEAEIQEARALIDTTHAKQKMLDEIQRTATVASAAAEKLAISEEAKAVLCGLVEMLVPKTA